MTHDELRTIDRQVAEKVMGRSDHLLGGLAEALMLPHYSTDIAAAWQVVEKASGFTLTSSDPTHHRYASLWFSVDRMGTGLHPTVQHGQATAPTAPLAICLAALKAKGVEVPHG